MRPVPQCHQPMLSWHGRETPSHEPPVPRVSPSTTSSFEGMGDASTGYFGTTALVEVGRVAAALLPAGPRCRSPTLSPLATRCLPSAGTGVAAEESRSVSRAAPEQLWRANQPGAQGLAATGSPATAAESSGSGGAGTYSWACHPAVSGGEEPRAWPARLPENQFLPPSWERTSALRRERAGIRQAPRDAAERPAPGTNSASPEKGLTSQHKQMRLVWESNPTPMQCSGTLVVPKPRHGICPCPRCFWDGFHPTNVGGCRAPSEQTGCPHPLLRSCPVSLHLCPYSGPKQGGTRAGPEETPHGRPAAGCEGSAGRVDGRPAAGSGAVTRAGRGHLNAGCHPKLSCIAQGAGATPEQGLSRAVQELVGTVAPAEGPVSAQHPAGCGPFGEGVGVPRAVRTMRYPQGLAGHFAGGWPSPGPGTVPAGDTQSARCPRGVGHGQDPHPSLGVPTRGVTAQSRRGPTVPRLAEQSQALPLTAPLLTGLNSTSKAGDVPVPIPVPSAPVLLYSGCPQREALQGKSRHTKARWYRQLGSQIIQGYNNYSSSGICPRSQCLEINPSSLWSQAQRPLGQPVTQSHASQKTT